MGRFHKVPKIPPAKGPAGPVTPEDVAKAKLAVEQQARAQRCMNEIRASLTKHNCTIIAQTIIHYDGRTPTFMWDVGAQ